MNSHASESDILKIPAPRRLDGPHSRPTLNSEQNQNQQESNKFDRHQSQNDEHKLSGHETGGHETGGHVVDGHVIDGNPSLNSDLMRSDPVNSRPVSWLTRIARCVDPRHWLRTILMLDDSPHSIALGTAIGLFVGFTPTVGIQMIIVVVIAFLTSRIFRFNRIAALIAVYISNPLTMVPMYWYNYRIGTLFFAETTSWNEFKHLFQYQTLSQWWGFLKALFATVGMPLLAGSFVVGTIVSLIAYPVVRNLASQAQQYRREHPRHPKARPPVPPSV